MKVDDVIVYCGKRHRLCFFFTLKIINKKVGLKNNLSMKNPEYHKTIHRF